MYSFIFGCFFFLFIKFIPIIRRFSYFFLEIPLDIQPFKRYYGVKFKYNLFLF